MLAPRFVHLRVGCSVAAFLRNFQTGEAALEAWKLHYVQLTPLLNEIEGFSPFMLVLFNNLQRDSIYGMVFRVTVGALLSTIDATTDIYTFYTYWQSGLHRQAMTLLFMILANLCFQVSERSERALTKTCIIAMNPEKWLQT